MFKIRVFLILLIVWTVFEGPGSALGYYNIGISSAEDDNASYFPFVKIGKKHYFFDRNERADWIGAIEACRRKGGYLADIESAEEMNLLNDMLMNEFHTQEAFVYLAGNDKVFEGQFNSINTGQKLKFYAWMKDQPDNYKGDEDCLQLWNRDGRFGFNDGKCSIKRYYLCELKRDKHFLTIW